MKTALTTNLLACTALLILTSVFSPAQALEYECINESEQRFIRLEMPGQEHLCEVSVTLKNDERDVKWYANSESAFCTEKTAELKGKYEDLWGFSCTKWPDTDGIDALTKRHRAILDAELKKQIALGEKSDSVVKAVKVIASSDDKDSSLLAMQFFHSRGNSSIDDVTHIIEDNGVSWFTQSKVKSLASYIPDAIDYQINSALVSSIASDGTIEVSTLVNDNDTKQNCYGEQTFLSNIDGRLIPLSPHRFVCE